MALEMRKHNRDLTQGNPLKQMLLFSLPLVLGNIFQQLYSTVDTAVVGRHVGTTALAAVGATGSLTMFILGFVSGLTGGFSILAAQARGAKDEEYLRHIIGNTVTLAGCIVLIFTPLALLLTRPLLRLVQTPEDIMDGAALYLSIVFGGYACTMLYNSVASLLRAMGDSRTPLMFLIVSSTINVVLDLFFVVKLSWGVAGVATATIIAQLVSGVLCVCYARRKYEVFRLHLADLKPDGALLRRMLGLGLPMAMQSSLTAVGMLIMQASINRFGSTVVAGYTAAHKVEALVSILAYTLGTSCATFVGQNLGAKQYTRMFRGVRAGILLCTIYAAASGVVCVFAGRSILSLFVDNMQPEAEAMLDTGVTYLRIFACFLWPYNALMVFRSSLQGMGRSIYTLLGGSAECVMRIVVSMTLPSLIGFAGCCLAGPAAWVGAIIPLIFAYFYEKRKLLRQVSEG